MTNDRFEQATRVAESGGNFMQGLGRVSNLIILVVVLGGIWFIYNKVTDWGGIAIDAGKAVVEQGVDGAAKKIEAAGEGAAKLRDATGEAITTATDGIDGEAVKEKVVETGEAADKLIDKGLGWLQEKTDKLNAATDGDRDTSVDLVPESE